jgi:hypothetical protein
MRRLIILVLVALGTVAAGCDHASDLSGAAGKRGKRKSRVERTAGDTDGIVADGGMVSVSAEDVVADETGASARLAASPTALRCEWGEVIDPEHVQIACEVLDETGAPIDADTGLAWELHGADGAVAAVGGGAGLALGLSLKKLIAAPIRTILTDGLHVRVPRIFDEVAKVLTLSFLDKLPGLKAAAGAGICLATSAFPALCLIKAGIDLAGFIAGRDDVPQEVKAEVAQAQAQTTPATPAPGCDGVNGKMVPNRHAGGQTQCVPSCGEAARLVARAGPRLLPPDRSNPVIAANVAEMCNQNGLDYLMSYEEVETGMVCCVAR